MEVVDKRGVICEEEDRIFVFVGCGCKPCAAVAAMGSSNMFVI